MIETWVVTFKPNEYGAEMRVVYAGPEIAKAVNAIEANCFNAATRGPYESIVEIQCWVNGEEVASMARCGLFAFERNHGPMIPEIEALYEVEK